MRNAVRVVEAGLWVAALACAGWWASATVQARSAERRAEQIAAGVDSARSRGAVRSSAGSAELPSPAGLGIRSARLQRAVGNTVPSAQDQIEVEDHPAVPTAHAGQVIGRLQIASVHLDVALLESYDAATLRKGVGHVPGTAVPGGLGNLVLAGHRDTFFRPLREIRPGMKAQVIAPDGRWWYVVDRTEIVDPDRVEVLEIGDRPEMTLITCYPFEFIGSAPKRFIVHAHLVSVEAG